MQKRRLQKVEELTLKKLTNIWPKKMMTSIIKL